MMMLTRRGAIRSAVAFLPGVALAGCSSSGSSGVLDPGEAVELDGLTIAYNTYRRAESIRPATATPDEGTETRRKQGGTPITAAAGRSLLALEFRMENGGDGSKGVPMPKPAPVLASGELSVENKARREDPSPIEVGPRVEVDGSTVGSLTHRLARRGMELAPSEAVSGWAFFRPSEDVDLSSLRVVLSGLGVELNADRARFEWRLVES